MFSLRRIRFLRGNPHAETYHLSWGLWLRRALAATILFTVSWLSLTDSDGLRAHEFTHFLAQLTRATHIPMDKWVHAIMYFAVCGAFWIAFPSTRRFSAPWAAFCCATLWGFLIECAQGFFTALGIIHRNFDWLDALANACGALLATLCILVWLLLWRRLLAAYRRIHP